MRPTAQDMSCFYCLLSTGQIISDYSNGLSIVGVVMAIQFVHTDSISQQIDVFLPVIRVDATTRSEESLDQEIYRHNINTV